MSDVGLGFICDRSNCWLPGVCVLGGGAAGEETDRCRVNYIVIVLITLAKTTLQAQPSLPSTSDEPLGSFSKSLRPLLQGLKFLLGPLP